MGCEPMMDARTVASLLGISLRTLDTLVARGEAPAFIRIGQARRWRMAEINNWIEARLDNTSHTGTIAAQSSPTRNSAHNQAGASS